MVERAPYIARVSLAQQQTGARIDPGTLAAPFAQLQRGAEQLGSDVDQFARVQQKARQAIELAKVSTAATRELDDLNLQLESEGDWQRGAARWAEGVKAIRARQAEAISEPSVKAQFELQFDQAAETRRVSLSRKLIDVMQKDGEASLLQTLDTQARAAAAAPNDVARQTAILAGGQAIANFRDARLIDPVRAVNLELKFKSDVDEAQARSLITADPQAALNALSDPQALPNLTPERRALLMDTATRRHDTETRQAIARAEHLERVAERELRKHGDEIAKDGWSRVHEGTLTFEWLQANRRTLSQGDYTALVKELRGDRGADDPTTVADLTARLAGEDIESDARRELQAGRLKTETYRSLVSQNRAALADDRPASPYKSGRELVNVTLRPPDVLGVGAAQDAARAAQAQALVEYDSWAAANPSADRAAHLEEAQNIIRRYQVVAFERMAIGVGLPRTYRGARQDLKLPDLDAAEQQTIQLLDARQLTADQAAQELRKIEAWREILARQPVKKAAGK